MVAAISTELEEFVQSELANGHFASREAVIAAALIQMRDRQAKCDQRVRDAIAERDSTLGENIVSENPEDFRDFANSIKTRERGRLVKERGKS